MTQHFEHIWENAEKISKDHFDSKNWTVKDVIADIQEDLLFLKMYDSAKDSVAFTNRLGDIIFAITYLSQKYNINTYTLLKEAMLDAKIDLLDPELDNTEM